MFFNLLKFSLDTSENISGEGKTNGHQTSPREKSDESDDENPVVQQTNGNTEQELNEQAAMTAAAAISGDTNKQPTSAESDTASRRKFNIYLFL